MKSIRRLLLVSAVVAISSTIASASTIFVEDTFTFGPGGSYGYNLPASISGSVTFNASLMKFDDNLLGAKGTLQNIAFMLSVTDIATASATNGVLTCNGAGCTPGGPLNVLTLGGSVPINVNGPSGMNTSTTPQATQSYGAPGHTLQNIFTSCVLFSCTVDNTQILTVTGLSDTTSSSTNVANNPTAFAPYHDFGGGNFISGLSITVGPASVVGVGDSNVQYSATSQITGSLKVVYTYDTGVPEPMTAGLTGSALVGIALLLRRKQARNKK